MPLVKYYGKTEKCSEFLRPDGSLINSPVDKNRLALKEEYPFVDGTETKPIAEFLLESAYYPSPNNYGGLIFDPYIFDRWDKLNIDLLPNEFCHYISPRRHKSFVFNGLVYGGEFHRLKDSSDQLLNLSAPSVDFLGLVSERVALWDLMNSIIKRLIRYLGADNTLLSFEIQFDNAFLNNNSAYGGCAIEHVAFGLLDMEGDPCENAERIENLVASLEGLD